MSSDKGTELDDTIYPKEEATEEKKDEILELLKFNLQEKKFPHFTDDELKILLKNFPDINEASYEGCLIKAYDYSVNVGPIKVEVDKKYWIRKAGLFKKKIKKSHKTSNQRGSVRYRSMQRADGT